MGGVRAILPGLATALAAVLVAWMLHLAIPAVPLLTAAVVLGIVAGQLSFFAPALDGPLKSGIRFSAKTLMRTGVVLLGLKLSLGDIADLGFWAIAAIVALVIVTFFGTWAMGVFMRLPGAQPLLVAAGFSICGASAIGAMSSATRSKPEEQATPVALVTLCGTLAIAVLPALQGPLGLSDVQFGHWVGASVHDVGQVVATAQIAGPAALAVAVVVKLTRVLLLAPVVAVVAVAERRRDSRVATEDAGASRPPLVPLFVVGFLAAVLVRTFVPLPDAVLAGADTVQTYLLATALFGLGAAVNVAAILRTGGRALAVGLLSWTLIASLAFAAVHLR